MPTEAEMRADLEAAGIDVDASLERLSETIRRGSDHLAAVKRRVAAAREEGVEEGRAIAETELDALRNKLREYVSRLKLHGAEDDEDVEEFAQSTVIDLEAMLGEETP